MSQEPTMKEVLSKQPLVDNGMFPIYDRLTALLELMGAQCGDHCSNACRMCAARGLLAAILYGPEGKP